MDKAVVDVVVLAREPSSALSLVDCDHTGDHVVVASIGLDAVQIVSAHLSLHHDARGRIIHVEAVPAPDDVVAR